MKVRHSRAETTVFDERHNLIVCQNTFNSSRCHYWYDEAGSNYATRTDDDSYFTLTFTKESRISDGYYYQVIRDEYSNVIAEYREDSKYSVIRHRRYHYDSNAAVRSTAIRTDDSYSRTYDEWRDRVDRMTFEVEAYAKPVYEDSYSSILGYNVARPARSSFVRDGNTFRAVDAAENRREQIRSLFGSVPPYAEEALMNAAARRTRNEARCVDPLSEDDESQYLPVAEPTITYTEPTTPSQLTTETIGRMYRLLSEEGRRLHRL